MLTARTDLVSAVFQCRKKRLQTPQIRLLLPSARTTPVFSFHPSHMLENNVFQKTAALALCSPIANSKVARFHRKKSNVLPGQLAIHKSPVLRWNQSGNSIMGGANGRGDNSELQAACFPDLKHLLERDNFRHLHHVLQQPRSSTISDIHTSRPSISAR